MPDDVLLSMVDRLMGEIYYFYEMNTFHRLMLLSWVGCVMPGCDAPDKKTAHAENTEFLRPDVFSASPDKVEGCVGLYTYDSLNVAFDSLDVDKGKKILATKTAEFAFIRLHHRISISPMTVQRAGRLIKRPLKRYIGEMITRWSWSHVLCGR